jgi:RimJ/RimL family protein N-acetyltransferase
MTGDIDTPIVTITGDTVTLGPISRDLVPLMTRWMNDLGAQQRLGFAMPGPFTIEAEEQWYDGVARSNEQVTFLIRERATGAPIGTTGLHGINQRNRSATFGIMIGDPSARGKGYGTEATSLILDFAFSVADLHSIDLTVAEFNLAGQRAYARAGFKECGRFRERIWMFGKWWDEVHMDCLASEFASPVLSRAHLPDQSR